MSDRKFLGICIVIAALIMAAALLLRDRYHYTERGVRYDRITGKTWRMHQDGYINPASQWVLVSDPE